MRWLRLLLATALFGVSAGVSGVAAACACGGVISSDVSAHVADETALLSTDGRTETMVMRLNLQSTVDNAAVVIPTPTPATVTSGRQELFTELETLTAPRVTTVTHWTLGTQPQSLAEGAPGGAFAGPRVVSQVQLGPVEATTLTGGGVDEVRDWLQANGYALRPEIAVGLAPYLREGWSVVAMRLTGPTPLNGSLDPVALTFASDRLVYPMRMSAQAATPQRALIYTLGQHRMQRGDPDAATQSVEVEYAGALAGRATDPTLTEMARNGDYLTRTSVQISQPGMITSDFEFTPAGNDEPFQRVLYRHEYQDMTPYLLMGGVLVAALLGVWMWRSR